MAPVFLLPGVAACVSDTFEAKNAAILATVECSC